MLSEQTQGGEDLLGFWLLPCAAAASAESLIPLLSAGERSNKPSRVMRELLGEKEGLWPSACTPGEGVRGSDREGGREAPV
jgi:hypothetical protein